MSRRPLANECLSSTKNKGASLSHRAEFFAPEPLASRGPSTHALHTLRTTTDYPNLEIIVIDTRPGTKAPWKAALALADRVIEDDAPFNWSRLNNRAAALARGDRLLFLNDDVAFTDPDWLRALIEPLQHEGVGITGPQLLYPSGAVQHAGMFLTRTGTDHSFHGCSATAPGPFGLALTPRNVSSVTGACLLIRRALFDQLAGFDERFDLTFNDVDLCLRAAETGARIVFTPHASLTHRESASRAGLPEAENTSLFTQRWSARLTTGDPYFNPNLSLAHTDHRPDAEPIELIYPSRPLARPDSIRRILLIKLHHIGDFILSLPAISRLKHHFPTARLTLLAAPDICRIAPMEPAIDDVIAYDLPEAGAPRSDPAWSTVLATLQTDPYDLAIDLRAHAETREILHATAATWRAGFDAGYAFPWLDIVGLIEPDLPQSAKRTHMADTLLDFANRIGAAFTPAWCPPRAPPSRIWPTDLPIPPLDATLRVALHPGAGTAIKRWPPTHFRSLINILSDSDRCWFVLVGGPDEADIADEILGDLAPAVQITSAIGQTSLDDLARLLRACDLFIGNDSGPHHLAASLGVPTIGLHSGVVDAREWSPLAPFALALRKQTVCSPCYLLDIDACPRARACLTDLPPATVLDIARQLAAPFRRPR